MLRTLRRWGPLWTALLVAVSVLLVVAAACGDDEEGPGETPTGETPTGETPAAETPTVELGPQPDVPQDVEDQVTEPVDGVIDTDMVDNLYTRNNLMAPLGETTTIRATNTGAAVHNLRIAGVDGEWNTDDDIVSDPEAVLAGEVGELDFSPTVPGVYTFRCDFHPLEQGGTITVE